MPVGKSVIAGKLKHIIFQNRICRAGCRRIIFFGRDPFHPGGLSRKTEDLLCKVCPAAASFAGSMEQSVIFGKRRCAIAPASSFVLVGLPNWSFTTLTLSFISDKRSMVLTKFLPSPYSHAVLKIK